jgi:hypothetical protein
MTTEEWFAAINPIPLLITIVDGPPNMGLLPPIVINGLRLFACAAARQVWDLLSSDARSSIHVSERFAQGRATPTDLVAAEIDRNNYGTVTASQLARAVAQEVSGLGDDDPQRSQMWHLQHYRHGSIAASMFAARAIATRDVGPAPPGQPTTPEWHAAWTAAFAAARAIQADYIRDIFPPPRYWPKHNPQWITSTVLTLAQQMDETGDFFAIPILADALQDAGCEDEMLLNCCRAAGNNHVRGNWVVELILARI